MVTRVLVVASTFPSGDDDPVPAFVKDQVVALKTAAPTLDLHVLAPHDRRSATVDRRTHPHFTEHRFHYMWPRRAERLAGRGILPELQAHPAMYAVLPFFVLGEAVALLRLARRLRPDVVYAHWFTPQAITGAWVARAVGARLVFTTHASDVAVWRKVPLVGGAVVRAHTARADRITAVSSRSLARLRGFFDARAWEPVAARTAVIPMGVHVPAVAADPAAETDTVLFVGRLAEKKGVPVLLRAFARAADRLPGWRLVVAGDGPLRADLQAQAAGLGLGDRVDFPGYVTGEAKADLVRAARVYAVPSVIAEDGDAEGLPVSLLEGLAAGKVCVATFESGADDVLHDGRDGFLVPQRDVDALADALVRAATLPPAAAEPLRRAARAVADAHAWPAVARRHLDFLFPGA